MTKKRKEPQVVIYKNWLAMFLALSTEQNGQILKAIANHVIKGEDTEVDEILTPMVEKLLSEIDENMENYINRCETNKRIASERWEKEKSQSDGVRTHTERSTNAVRTEYEKSTKGVPTNTNTNTKTNNNIKETLSKESVKKVAPRFLIPSIDEIKAYCIERHNDVDPQAFFDFYSSKGWKVGNQPMKDWKAAVRTWERRDDYKPKPKAQVNDLDAAFERVFGKGAN